MTDTAAIVNERAREDAPPTRPAAAPSLRFWYRCANRVSTAVQPVLYLRTFSTDWDNLICKSRGGEKEKLGAPGGRRSSFPRIQRIGSTGLLIKPNDLKCLPARLCLFFPSMAAIAF